MDLYNKISSGNLEPSDELFKQMMNDLFDYEDGSDIYSDFEKAPVFYKEFMGKNCTPFFEVLTKISKNVTDKNMLVYKDANIVTLMAAATFHMNKLYCMKNRITDLDKAKDCDNFISDPFCSWLIDFAELYPQVDIYQNSKYFKKPYTYLILNSYVSFSNNKFKKVLKELFDTIKDALNDIVIPITDDAHTDIYGLGLILYKKWDHKIAEYTIVNDFISNRSNFMKYEKKIDLHSRHGHLLQPLSVFESFKWLSETHRKTYINNIYKYLKTVSVKKYELCMIVNKYKNILFNIKDDTIVKNDKSVLYITNMFQLIETSDNLIFDTLHLCSIANHQFVEYDFSDYTTEIKETLLHPIIRNIIKNPITKNISFVKSLLMFVFLDKVDKYYKYYCNYPHNGAEFLYEVIIYGNIEYDQYLLFEILDTYFVVNNQSLSVKLSPAFGYETAYSNTKYSLNVSDSSPISPSTPCVNDVNKIKELIRIFVKYLCEYTYNIDLKNSFFTKLWSYNKFLLTLDIDIDKYESYIYKFSAVLKSRSPRRSINNEKFTSPVKMNSQKKKDNMFYKKIKKDQVTEFQGIKFADTALLHKLQKYYIQTVAGMATGEYDKPDRIAKIRKYLQIKYPTVMDFEYKLRVHKGKDFETLFNYWLNDANQMTLNAKYYIINIDENGQQEDGIDAGGLTKSFFTNIIKQMKDVYFKQAYENSDKYILDTTDPNVARFIGELLCVLILREIYLDFNISTVYLGHLMYDNLKAEEQFMYYLLDIDSDVTYNYYLQYCENDYKYESEYEENYYYAMACNPEYIVKETMADIYKADNDVFKAFCKGFFIEKKIFYNKFFNIKKNKIRIYDMDKLLTMTKLSKKALKSDIFDKIPSVDKTTIVYKWFEEIMIKDKKTEYTRMYSVYDASYIQDDNIKQQAYKELASQQVFKQNVLLFWTGCRGPLNQPYSIQISDIYGNQIKSHTCFNRLELPTAVHISSKQMLFDKMMEMFVAGLESGYSDR
jgi:hypothetical protein